MMRRAFLRLTVLWLGLVAAAAAPAANLLIVGDSLSDAYNIPREAGWAHLLAERLGGEHAVINASISGETTAGAVSRIEDLVAAHAPDVLLVILGGNDGLRGLNPSQIEQNLGRILDTGLATGAEVLLMQMRMPPNLGPAYVRRFEAVYPSLAERPGVTLVPFFLEPIFERPGMMMPDGIHPTAAAQAAMLEVLWPFVAQALADD